AARGVAAQAQTAAGAGPAADAAAPRAARPLPPPAAAAADADGPAPLAVANEDVGEPVRVARDQVRRVGQERQVAAVGADRRRARLAAAARLMAVARDVEPHRLAGLEVAQVDVLAAVRVVRDEIAGVGVEGHVAPVGADLAVAAEADGLCIRAGDADAG